MGGGSKQLTSLYINKDGSNKALSNAYGNINGTNKEIFSRLYKWAKHTWSTDGVQIRYATNETNETSDGTGWMDRWDAYRYKELSGTNWKLSGLVTIDFGSNYITINGNKTYYNYNSGEVTLDYGIKYKYEGNDHYFWFTTPLYGKSAGGYESNPEDPYLFYDDCCVKMTYYHYTSPGVSDATYTKEYTQYYSRVGYKWKPNSVEYVTSTDKNAYTENNTSINVNSTFNYWSSTSFEYNPTYRFIG